MNQQNKDITFSTENIIKVRIKRTGFYVDAVDWDRLKRWVNNSRPSFNFWATLSSGAYSSSFSIFLTYLSITDPNYPYKTFLMIAMAVTLVVGVMSTVFTILQKKTDTYDSQQIIQEMDTMAITPSETTEEVSEEVEIWTASNKNDVPQGTDNKELSIGEGKITKFLTFQVSSSSSYWRAGCKLCISNQKQVSPLLSPGSILFHTGVENGKVLVYFYENGVKTPIVNRELAELSITQPITLTVESMEGRARFYLNNSLIKEAELSPSYFEAVYLLGWGDGHIYNVDFSEIAFKSE